jgi:flagellar basal-body rod protein FlgB
MRISDFIFGKTDVPVLNKALDAYAMRQKSIADNIANADTPGYKRSEVSFEEDLKAALDKKGVSGFRTNPRHLPVGKPRIDEVKSIPFIPKDNSLASGKNNVDIEHEMAELAKNQINFTYGSRLMELTFNRLKSAIRGEPVR